MSNTKHSLTDNGFEWGRAIASVIVSEPRLTAAEILMVVE
jgi:hypothetical protein